MRVRFHLRYFIFFMLLFIIEVLIALYINDSIIRPYGGDVLVVILIYCFVRAFFEVPVRASVMGVLLFSYLIEFLQYLNFVKLLGLENNALANVVMGNSFAWMDMLAYTLGALIILLVESWPFGNK